MQLKELRGISEKREKDLNKLNIFTAEDLVRHFPRAYLDLTQQAKLSDCYHNDVALIACRVVSEPQVAYGRRPFVKVWCDQGGERFSEHETNIGGVTIVVDHQTGNQYLSTPGGIVGLTDADGTLMWFSNVPWEESSMPGDVVLD